MRTLRLLGALAVILAASSAFAEAASVRLEDWKELRALPAPVERHRVVACDGALLVLGGKDRAGKLKDEVLRAKLTGGGDLRAWGAEKRALPYAMADHGASFCEGIICVTGGILAARQGEQASSRVWLGRVSGAGAIREWREGASLPGPLYQHAQASYQRWTYVAGGMSRAGQSNEVFIGEMDDSGAIKSWRETLPLPVPLSQAAALVAGNYLLVAGGQSPGQGKTLAMPTVYAAPIWQDGSLRTWYLANPKLPGAWLSFGRSDASLVFFSGSLFCFGGQDSLWFPIRNIATAAFDVENGEMGSFGLRNAPDGFPESARAAAWKDRVYLVGGKVEGKISAAVLAGRFVAEKEKTE